MICHLKLFFLPDPPSLPTTECSFSFLSCCLFVLGFLACLFRTSTQADSSGVFGFFSASSRAYLLNVTVSSNTSTSSSSGPLFRFFTFVSSLPPSPVLSSSGQHNLSAPLQLGLSSQISPPCKLSTARYLSGEPVRLLQPLPAVASSSCCKTPSCPPSGRPPSLLCTIALFPAPMQP